MPAYCMPVIFFLAVSRTPVLQKRDSWADA